SERRDAMTAPADPPPTTIKSNSSDIAPLPEASGACTGNFGKLVCCRCNLPGLSGCGNRSAGPWETAGGRLVSCRGARDRTEPGDRRALRATLTCIPPGLRRGESLSAGGPPPILRLMRRTPIDPLFTAEPDPPVRLCD